MVPSKNDGILARLGVRPVINGCGVYTDLGGSRPRSGRPWRRSTRVSSICPS